MKEIAITGLLIVNYHLLFFTVMHQEAGKKGEALAARYLEDKGYQIQDRNYRHRRAEIDLIAKKDDLLVFVEVKARSSTAFGYPEDFVDEKQASRIISAADQYVRQINWSGDIRFDIIAVMMQNKFVIRHFEDAFY